MRTVKLRTMGAIAGGTTLILFVLTYFILIDATPINPTYDVRLGLMLANFASLIALAAIAVAGLARFVLRLR